MRQVCQTKRNPLIRARNRQTILVKDQTLSIWFYSWKAESYNIRLFSDPRRHYACVGLFYFWQKTGNKPHNRFLLALRGKWDNKAMETIFEKLKQIGLADDEIARIKTYYQNDPDGLLHYYLYMRAILDDRHEYV